MARPALLQICHTDLFTAQEELAIKYSPEQVNRLLRIRELYTYFLAHPDSKDRQLVEQAISRHGISKTVAYEDIAVIKQLLPVLSEASRDFHRYRYNELILETYQMAKSRKDTKTMERAASSYAKFNRIDLEDEMAVPYDMIVVQPFTATSDPTVLGIKPIPNVDEVISRLVKKYSVESRDIEDIECEEADTEEQTLFKPLPHGTSVL